MSPFMSSMPRAGLERNAARIEAHALADEGERLGVPCAAVPAHDDDAARPRRALANAEQRAHAERLHRGHVENFDFDAELFQLLGLVGEVSG